MPAPCTKCQTPIPEDVPRCPGCGADAPTDPGGRAKTDVHAKTEMISTAEWDALPERLGAALGSNYQVRGLAGRGGFALVFEVWDKNLERRLAAKVLNPEIAAAPGVIQRFTHEAKTVARLVHPAILPIHFVGTGEHLAYYVMPFVVGQSLRERLDREGKLPIDQAIDVIKPVLQALGHAHQAGVIHRDIKPDNVMLDAEGGRVVLMDFGIAKALDPAKAHTLTQTGYAVGTPHFMSPEQALGDKVDARSDLYSVGVMLYEMVIGAKPYDGETSQEVVSKHVTAAIPVPSRVDPNIPAWLSDFIVRCMQKDPNTRFQRAEEMSEVLELGPDARMAAMDVGAGDIIVGSRFSMDDMMAAAAAPRDPTVPIPAAPDGAVPGAPPDAAPAGFKAGAEVPPSGSADGGTGGGGVAGAPAGSVATPAPRVFKKEKKEKGKKLRRTRKLKGPKGEAKRRGPAMLIVLFVLLMGAGGAYLVSSDEAMTQAKSLLARVGLFRSAFHYVDNALIVPVTLMVDGQTVTRIEPGMRGSFSLGDMEGKEVLWRLVQPRREDDQPMGQEVEAALPEGVAQDDGNRFTTISALTAQQRLVAPLVTNRLPFAMVALVNPRTDDETRCNCVIPVGAVSMPIGYYMLRDDTEIWFYRAARPYRGTPVRVRNVADLTDTQSGGAGVMIGQ